MAKKLKIDLLELLGTGKSGPIALGKTSLAELTESLADPEAISWKSWHSSVDIPTNITSDPFEFEFSESKHPLLRRLKIRIDYIGAVWGQSRAVHGNLRVLEAGRTTWSLGKLKWADIASLPEAIRFLNRNSYEIGSGPEKQIFLVWTCKSRQLVLEYLLQPLSRDENLYEFDYFLNVIRLADYGQYGFSKKALEKVLKGTK